VARDIDNLRPARLKARLATIARETGLARVEVTRSAGAGR
jgi:hypothetical protein